MSWRGGSVLSWAIAHCAPVHWVFGDNLGRSFLLEVGLVLWGGASCCTWQASCCVGVFLPEGKESLEAARAVLLILVIKLGSINVCCPTSLSMLICHNQGFEPVQGMKTKTRNFFFGTET